MSKTSIALIILALLFVDLTGSNRAAQARTDPERDTPLFEAVERLNQQHTNVPPLTEEEVIAAVRTIKDKHPDIEEAVYRVFQRVAAERVLLKGMYFEHTDG
jgi:hypothetical protein